MFETLETPREKLLAEALLHSEVVWNSFIQRLCSNLYPERVPGSLNQAQFNGSADDRIFEIFKILDSEVRRIGTVLREIDIDPTRTDEAFATKVFDTVSGATGITENSHGD